MADAPTTVCSEATTAYNASQKVVTEGMPASTLLKDFTAWKHRESFCTWICIPQYLKVIGNPVYPLKISAEIS